jgi:type IV pilus assembly protein PilB
MSATVSNDQLKALLSELDIVPSDKLQEAYDEAQKQAVFLGEVLVDKDLATDDQIGQLVAQNLGYQYVNLSKQAIDDAVLHIIPRIMAKSQQVIAFGREESGEVKLAMVNPDDLATINLIRKKTGEDLNIFYTTAGNIKNALVKYQKGIEEEFSSIIKESINEAAGASKAQDFPIIKIVDTIISYAYDNKTSDIHIEPGDDKTLVRFRIDGILHDIVELPKNIHDLVITRIKIMSQLRTDEHLAAQDGKLRFDLTDEHLDIRVSIVPVVGGEKIVMRLLSDNNRQFSLEDLGFSSHDLIKIKKEYSKPYGMILSTGPTGSGKTTTLYAILKILNKREINISTIEDPVEYDIDSVNQIQVNSKTGLTFANGLRSILRQDPDIIMVGEIRDEETADIAINSAMTGHLVLSTLHTNDAPTAMPRFLEMNIEPFLVASTVNIVVAQRLIRKICSNCVVSEEVALQDLAGKFSKEFVDSNFEKAKKTVRLYRGKGCKLCNSTGYRGRVGIFEVMPVSEPIRKLIMQRANADEIRAQAVSEGMQTMIKDGVQKSLAGVTTLEEVLRATKQ